jgi:hypothetical protein
MSPVDVMTMVKNLDRRLSAVEQILPTLATKDDLKAFATKEDLKAFATKEDLKAFATKEDLASGLEEVRRFALVLHEDLKSDIHLIAEHLADVMTRLPRRNS